MAVIGNSATQQSFTPAVDYFSGNGSTTAFTLSRPVASVAQVEAVIDNVVQNPSSAYTVSGNTITFTSAPLSGTNNIYVRYTSPITQVIAPGQGTVSSTSLASSTGSGAVVLATSPTITTPTLSGDTTASTINGLTVGKGGGSVASNTVVGNAAGASNTTGSGITAIGYQTLYANTTGVANTAVGGADGVNSIPAALTTNNTGSNNTAIGTGSLKANTTASYNVAVGNQSGYSNVLGSANAFFGFQAGYLSAPASALNAYNTFIGCQAGYNITTGIKNTIIGTYNGNQGGLDIRTASNYIVLSDGDGNPRQYIDNNAYFSFGGISPASGQGNIGYIYAFNGGANNICMTGTTTSNARYTILEHRRPARSVIRCSQISVGENSSNQGEVNVYSSAANADVSGGVTLVNGATSWSAISDENKKDIIEPIRNGLSKVATLRAVIGKYKTDEDGTRRSFLIAQDVQAVLPEAVGQITDITDGSMALGLSYTDVIPLLVASIKELKALVDAQATEIAELKAKVGV